jgi:signal peptidase I
MVEKRTRSREYLEALLVAVIFLRFANTFVVQTFYIPSSSMEDTLLVGDHLFVNRFMYGPAALSPETLLPFRPVRRGDIVIFRSPEKPTLDLVKRCIGLPGDEVQIIDKGLIINGQWVDDSSFAQHRDRRVYPDRPPVPLQMRRRDSYGPVIVPQGHYFCLGDNRDFSYDSRYWGTVPHHLLKGRAVFIYWSYDREGLRDYAQRAASLPERLFRRVVGFFAYTRWRRFISLIR